MAEPKDSAIDKAENLARRILERLGSKVDSKLASKVDSRLASSDQQTLGPSLIGNLASRIEQLIETTRKQVEHGTQWIAPNRFKVLFSYEETSALSEQYMESVSNELTATAFEFINNRRYQTRGPVVVHATQDLFVKSTTLKASFEDEPAPPETASQSRATSPAETLKTISFQTVGAGRTFRVQLKAEGAPAYIGRAAGNAVRLDDPSVSRLHCSLSLRTTGTIVVADVGSANGTYVNEELLGPDETRPLKLGDVVGVGDFRLTVSEIY